MLNSSLYIYCVWTEIGNIIGIQKVDRLIFIYVLPENVYKILTA